MSFVIYMISKISQPKNFLCQIYWDSLLGEKKSLGRSLDHSISSKLHRVNYCLAVGKHDGLSILLNKFIAKADLAFKQLKPTSKNMTIWRGIGKPYSCASNMAKTKFEKTLNLKKGDVIFMPEYAYATNLKNLAEDYADDNGILYEIIVPKGSKINQSSYCYNFPRSSRFECIETKNISGKQNYRLIKLKYLNPQEQPKSFFSKIKSYFQKL